MILEASVELQAGRLVWIGEPFESVQDITEGFGTERNNTWGYHTGLDSVARGDRGIRYRRRKRIVWVGVFNPWDDRRTTNGGYGNTVLLEDEDGTQTRQAHLASFGPVIADWIARGYPQPAPWLEAGELVGIQGNTGYALSGGQLPPAGNLEWARHSHMELLVPRAGGVMQPVNPARYAVRTPVLTLPEKQLPSEPPIMVPATQGALREVQLLKRTIELARMNGVPDSKIVDMMQRELGEVIVSLGG